MQAAQGAVPLGAAGDRVETRGPPAPRFGYKINSNRVC